MNLSELRRFKFQEKFLYLLENMKFTVAQDQDYLNRLCKGRVKIVDNVWNAMPMPELGIDANDVKLVHYNLNYKPWHYDNILYQEFFWKYAQKTEFYDEIVKMQKNYTEKQKFDDFEND